MPIRVLSETVAAQIAAGEVIERPASVVKELIENALDAGARRIEVEVSGSGVGLIRVADDGIGIPAAEIELALLRHATSKLSTVEDLDRIRTLGFRGEALASIAAVARLTLTSRHVEEAVGMRIVVEGGTILDKSSVGVPFGTTLEAANLFFNVPARRKFLKSEVTERRSISNLIMRYAMAYPDVRFALYNDEREAFRTSGSGDVAEVIIDTLGIDLFRDMVEVAPLDNHRPDLPPIKVEGYSTVPSQTRSNRSQIILFINGRSIQDQRITYAVIQAYHAMIPQGRYPVSVLMITLPPEEVDVNVHPTKAEVRFRTPDAVFSAVQRAVRQAVLGQSQIAGTAPGDFRQFARGWDAPQDETFFASLHNAPRVVNPEQLGLELDTPDRGRRVNQKPWDEDDAAFLSRIPDGNAPISQPRKLPPMRVVGQIAATYIVAEGPFGLYLIDQHAAHERIMYEVFMARHTAQEKMRQHTLESTVVQLSPINAQILEGNLILLNDLGFEIEPFGTHTFQVRAVPAPLADYDPSDVLYRIVADLENEDMPGAKTIEEKLIRRVCKTAAVKAGQVLSYDEMMGLIRQLERCEAPLTCPHGRPTMIHMSADELAKQFGRT